MTTLSFNKFYIWSNVENEDIAIHCSVCGRTETVSSRLDDLVEWAEQHDCPVKFRIPSGDKET